MPLFGEVTRSPACVSSSAWSGIPCYSTSYNRVSPRNSCFRNLEKYSDKAAGFADSGTGILAVCTKGLVVVSLENHSCVR